MLQEGTLSSLSSPCSLSEPIVALFPSNSYDTSCSIRFHCAEICPIRHSRLVGPDRETRPSMTLSLRVGCDQLRGSQSIIAAPHLEGMPRCTTTLPQSPPQHSPLASYWRTPAYNPCCVFIRNAMMHMNGFIFDSRGLRDPTTTQECPSACDSGAVTNIKAPRPAKLKMIPFGVLDLLRTNAAGLSRGGNSSGVSLVR
jgi:hypothetical protein